MCVDSNFLWCVFVCVCVFVCNTLCMCVCIVCLYCIVYCVAPVITDYRHLASDPGPGNESIHGEVVHKPTIDSLLPAQMRKHKVLTRLREKNWKHKTRSIYVLETVPSPFPPREEHQGGFIQEKPEPGGQRSNSGSNS